MPVLFSTRITSPYTLVSDDIVELVLSHLPHSPTQTDIATDSNSDIVSGLDWSTRPAGEERLAIPWPTDTVDVEPDNSLPKRSPKSLHTRGISSKTRITSLDAVRSAQSLISAMRDVATRTDDDLPLRQSQISVIRSVLGQQFVFPDEAAADEGDICALPTVTREVYGTVFSTATGRNPAAVAAPVVYQSTIQPTGPPPITPIPVADPNPQPPNNGQLDGYSHNYIGKHVYGHCDIVSEWNNHCYIDSNANVDHHNNNYIMSIPVPINHHVYIYNYRPTDI
ncbi:hypothetical protein IW146_007636, partial [Coemansia sp. RSA 922]